MRTSANVFGILVVSLIVTMVFMFGYEHGLMTLMACATTGVVSYFWGVGVGRERPPA
jgi:hypothetical protein